MEYIIYYYIYKKNQPKVGKYTIHGSSGYEPINVNGMSPAFSENL